MGFGGGSSGSFSLPNHKHTNTLLDGGELKDLETLVDGATLNAYIQAKLDAQTNLGQQKLIETHRAITTETSYTFNFTQPDMDNEYLVLDGFLIPTLNFTPQCVFGDGTGAFYGTHSARLDASSWLFFSDSAQTKGTLFMQQLVQPSSYTKFRTEIFWKDGTTKELGWTTIAMTSDGNAPCFAGGNYNNSGITTLDQLVVSTSTSTWKAGSVISLYKVTR